MEDADSEPEVKEERLDNKKSNGKVAKKVKYRMMPAPIESFTEFNVATYLQNLPCELTVGQAAHAIPRYRSGMQKATRRSRGPELGEKEANYVRSEEDEATTAAKCVLRIGDKAVSVIIDSGAATSIMTKSLM